MRNELKMIHTEIKSSTKQELLKVLAVQPYILALWEKRAAIAPLFSEGEAHYTASDVQKLMTIKEFLYEKGYTLDAALRQMHTNPTSLSASAPSSSPPFQAALSLKRASLDKALTQKLHALRDKLTVLRDLL